MGKLEKNDEHKWPIFNRIRFGTFVKQEVKFGVSFLASPRKPKNSDVFVAMHV